jgi:hypothetical protein
MLQGLVLGPLTFPFEYFYKLLMFADDTSILCTAKDFNNLKMKLNIVIMHMSMCIQSNKFALNLDETQMIKFIPTSATIYPLHILYFNKILKVVDTIQFWINI